MNEVSLIMQRIFWSQLFQRKIFSIKINILLHSAMVFNIFMTLKPFYFYVHETQTRERANERLKGIHFYAEWFTNYEDIFSG